MARIVYILYCEFNVVKWDLTFMVSYQIVTNDATKCDTFSKASLEKSVIMWLKIKDYLVFLNHVYLSAIMLIYIYIYIIVCVGLSLYHTKFCYIHKITGNGVEIVIYI